MQYHHLRFPNGEQPYQPAFVFGMISAQNSTLSSHLAQRSSIIVGLRAENGLIVNEMRSIYHSPPLCKRQNNSTWQAPSADSPERAFLIQQNILDPLFLAPNNITLTSHFRKLPSSEHTTTLNRQCRANSTCTILCKM